MEPDPESESVPVPDYPVHPMLLPHVLERIFKSESLSTEDLLRMRSVCQEWRVHATKAYGARASLSLTGDCMSSTAMFSAAELSQEPHADFPMPSTLRVESSFFCEHSRMLNTLQRSFANFLELTAPQLEVLSFSLTSRTDAGLNFAPFESQISFPKLREFSFFTNTMLTGCQAYLLRIATTVLTNSPRLKEVKIFNNIREGMSTEMALDEILRNIPASVKKIQLRKRLLDSSTEILAGLTLRNPKSLSLELKNSNGLCYRHFFQMFRGFNETLTELSVKCYSGGVKFPVFPCLTTLTLELAAAPVSGDPPHSVQPFSSIFPNVTNLNMAETCSYVVLRALFPPGFHAPQVHTCELPDIITSPDFMLNLAQGFSNIKKLIVSPLRVQKTLPVIFGNMLGLEELIIFFKRPLKRVCVDAVLTGIPKLECRNIRTAGNYEIINLLEVKTNPGITDLKQLKSLRIRCVSTKRLFLTDITAYLGFLKMDDNLKDLKVDSFHLSAACIEQLKVRYGEDTIVNPELLLFNLRSEIEMHGSAEPNEEESDSEFEVADSEESSEYGFEEEFYGPADEDWLDDWDADDDQDEM